MFEQLILIHSEAQMCDAFRRRFEGFPNVTVLRLRFEKLEQCDCFVTAGNAFGLMTAGIDAAVVHRFGESIKERVQHRILDDYYGEQPVGTAFLVRSQLRLQSGPRREDGSSVSGCKGCQEPIMRSTRRAVPVIGSWHPLHPLTEEPRRQRLGDLRAGTIVDFIAPT